MRSGRKLNLVDTLGVKNKHFPVLFIIVEKNKNGGRIGFKLKTQKMF